MGFFIQPTWPFTREELESWNGLAVTVEHDVVRLWLINTDRSWMSASLDREDEISMRHEFWEAKVSFFTFF